MTGPSATSDIDLNVRLQLALAATDSLSRRVRAVEAERDAARGDANYNADAYERVRGLLTVANAWTERAERERDDALQLVKRHRPKAVIADSSLHHQFERYVSARGLVFEDSAPSGRKIAEEAVEYAVEVAAGNHDAAKLELADVVLAACRQAELLETTVEECVEAKIAHDAGRETQADERDAMLAELVDPDPCLFDHNGDCQAHGWTIRQPGGLCGHERVRRHLRAVGVPFGHDAEPTSSLADTEQAEVDTMRWNGREIGLMRSGSVGLKHDPPDSYPAEAIVAWVNTNGGEARYEPHVTSNPYDENDPGQPGIAIRQADGTDDYAYAGDEVVKGEWFDVDSWSLPAPNDGRLREFTVRRAADTEGASS